MSQTIIELFKAYDEYIELLNAELNGLVGIAVVHGWHSTRYEQGVVCRQRIKELKEKFINE